MAVANKIAAVLADSYLGVAGRVIIRQKEGFTSPLFWDILGRPHANALEDPMSSPHTLVPQSKIGRLFEASVYRYLLPVSSSSMASYFIIANLTNSITAVS